MSANEVFARLERISRHKMAMCVLAAVLTMGIRIVCLPLLPIPQPRVHDEFSYLLGAETFASGRITNPPHPMWVHFETFHELMQPTYMTKYPPGQSLFLALGWKLFGHPWFGVLLSFGFFYGCLCWMLGNWVPPVYAVLGTAMTFTHISVFNYWINSYWGGAVAAGAGCLFLGTLPRLSRRVKSLDVVLAAIGLVLLANSRPYEGLIMSVAAFVALFYWRRRQKRKPSELLALRSILPFLLVLGSGMLLDCYYNYRVTGHAFLMPYIAYTRDYAISPSLTILPELSPPAYRHAELEKFWKGPDLEHYRKERSNILYKLVALNEPLHFYLSFLLLFPILAGVLLSRSFRVWIVVAITLCLGFGFLLVNGFLPHYVAGGVGLLAVLAAYGLRVLRVASNKYGRSLVLILVILMCVQLMVRQSRERSLAQGSDRHFISPRSIVTNICRSDGQRHLILVHYSSNHNVNEEFVYNSADIDSSFIVWARDMGAAENQELIDYFKSNRKIWLWQPDVDPAALTPYNAGSSGPPTNASGY